MYYKILNEYIRQNIEVSIFNVAGSALVKLPPSRDKNKAWTFCNILDLLNLNYYFSNSSLMYSTYIQCKTKIKNTFKLFNVLLIVCFINDNTIIYCCS